MVFSFLSLLVSCQSEQTSTLETQSILVTAESGSPLSKKSNVSFQSGTPNGTTIEIIPTETKQSIEGIGSSFTESSAFVLAHLEPGKRKAIMQNAFGADGANFSLTRTHVGSCDFSVEGKYSYLDQVGDTSLASFTLSPDLAGFNKETYPGIVDESYDLLPMIKEVQEVKQGQTDQSLRIISSAWTAPSWMKDIEDWFVKGAPENNYQGTGGVLKPEYEETYANYLIRYLDAYSQEGVDIWGMTPVNEPQGNNGQWESMHFTPESQNTFIKNYLGPKLQNSAHQDIQLLIYDQNRDHLEEWTNVILGDPETSKMVAGTAIHWYASTFKVFENAIAKVKQKFPDHTIIHTEGCIDDLGKPAPNGIGDPDGFQEEDWFQNDSFWWNPNATDWGYTAPWDGVIKEDHPIYTPVHRYARNIIVGIDHGLSGWVDWNMVLDHNGGPNHVGNFCGAPIMIHTETKEVYYTPIYHVLAQFSKTIRPGDRAIQTKKTLENLPPDALHTCATINEDGLISIQLLNTTKEKISCNLKLGDQFAAIELEANAIQTVQVKP